MNNVELYYYLATHKLSNEEYNALVRYVMATDNEHVFNTKYKDVKSTLDEFLYGKYKLVSTEEKDAK